MNIQDFNAIVDATVKRTADLLISKGEEYAGSADRLANFKRGAGLTGSTPMQVLLVYMSKHYDSIATFIRKDAQGLEQQLSEPISGRIDDMINYLFLLQALVVETEAGKKQLEYPALPMGCTESVRKNYKLKVGDRFNWVATGDKTWIARDVTEGDFLRVDQFFFAGRNGFLEIIKIADPE